MPPTRGPDEPRALYHRGFQARISEALVRMQSRDPQVHRVIRDQERYEPDQGQPSGGPSLPAGGRPRVEVPRVDRPGYERPGLLGIPAPVTRSEEHTSELQSHSDLVCRLLLEK